MRRSPLWPEREVTTLPDDRFEILFVCHANLCRSPLAERLTRHAIEDVFGRAPEIFVSSAGTHAVAGAPMYHRSAEVLDELGVDSSGFTSRLLTPSMLNQADLVVVAGREQRAACVTLAPATNRRAFTLRQFGRFVTSLPTAALAAEGTTADRFRVLVEQIDANRHLVRPTSAQEDDLPDPVGRPIDAFRVCADEIWQTMRGAVGVIAAA
jgi:protein-tyrosine phosphatase